jgi:hypothetical protein
MAGSGMKGRRGRVLQYGFGAALCLLAALNVLLGAPWYLSLGIIATGVIIILGRRRIFRPAVDRTTDEIICRYIPWYEGNVYALNAVLPTMGAAFIAAGYAPGYPAWLRFGGIILLCLTPLSAFAAVRMWRRCFLRISASVLTVRLAKGEATEIRREFVESILPKIVPNGVSGESLQVEIGYHATGVSTNETQTVLLGLQLSVKPINLLNALAYWEDAGDDDPTLLLDRIEQILVGRATAGA